MSIASPIVFAAIERRVLSPLVSLAILHSRALGGAAIVGLPSTAPPMCGLVRFPTEPIVTGQTP